MSFVFISHASDNKDRVGPIVLALIDAGLKVWLDNPAHPALKFPAGLIEGGDFHRLARFLETYVNE